MPNPLWHMIFKTTGKCVSFTKGEKINDENCRILRAKIRDYIIKRKAGECKSTLDGSSDVLSLMLESPNIFSDEDIIDEILDLLVAGTVTTQNASQVAMAHFMTDPRSLARARAEID